MGIIRPIQDQKNMDIKMALNWKLLKFSPKQSMIAK
jgi:hypothetical protein